MRITIRNTDAGVSPTRRIRTVAYKFVAQYSAETEAWSECYALRRGGYTAEVTRTKKGFNVYKV